MEMVEVQGDGGDDRIAATAAIGVWMGGWIATVVAMVAMIVGRVESGVGGRDGREGDDGGLRGGGGGEREEVCEEEATNGGGGPRRVWVRKRGWRQTMVCCQCSHYHCGNGVIT